mmetsp:Transcript_29092/g.37545  ORF Transcript_29092/g.37545 Transcript_29092/m.37545 type:complete len:89 (+) Transcript_29092:677-943(+)
MKKEKAKKRKERADREAIEAEELLKVIRAKNVGERSGGGDSLVDMIQSRNKERINGFDNWAAGLEERYAAMEEEKKAKRKAKMKKTKK